MTSALTVHGALHQAVQLAARLAHSRHQSAAPPSHLQCSALQPRSEQLCRVVRSSDLHGNVMETIQEMSTLIATQLYGVKVCMSMHLYVL